MNYFWCLLLLFGLGACSDSFALPSETLPPLPTIIALPSPTPMRDTGWQPLSEGLEKREWRIYANNLPIHYLFLVRIDPTYYRFDIAYSPGSSQLLSQWLQQTGADLVVNGGFFTEKYQATGLIIVDGQPSGLSYNFGGMVTIQDGTPSLRWLSAEPYQPTEAIDAALQSFPVLILPNGQVGITPSADGSDERARRTVIAIDQQGRVIFLVVDSLSFTLPELANFLIQSDLNLQIALNLDGGTSSGLLFNEPRQGVAAYTTLPVVFTVSRR